ncbi:MAG: cache domain-containing protein [Syntrophales bacterium]|jgi:cytochrome c
MLEKSQKEKAREWVAKAIAFYKESGKEIALAEFTNPKGPFVQEAMYIFVLDTQGTMLAHGVNERYVGQNFINIKDSAGRDFVRDVVHTVNAEGSGWVDYQWYNPVTKDMKHKSVYFEMVDDMIICSGIYTETLLDVIFNISPDTDINLFDFV